MAQPAAVLSILVTASAKQAQVALAKTQAQLATTTKTANATSASMKRLGTAAKWGGAVLAGGLYFGLKKSVEEAREANKVMAVTEQRIKKTGGAANVSAKQVENLSKKLSEQVGIDDELIQANANFLLSFKNVRNEVGRGNKVFDDANKMALDLAEGTGTSLLGATKQLGKALNDPIKGLTALSRGGTQFSEEQTEIINKMVESGDLMGAQKKILKELETQYGGTAKKMADSGDRLTVIFNNMAEDIGQKVVPVLSDMAEKVGDVLSNKKLTGEQKADRLAKYFTKMFSKGLDALEDALPRIAEMGGQMGLRLAQSFGKAFIEADLLGKLFLGGLLFKAVGGMTAIRGAGESAGKVFGRAFAYGAVALFGIELLTWLMKHRDDIIAAAQNKTTYQQFLMDEEGFTAKKALNLAKITERNPGSSLADAEKILEDQKKFQHDLTKITKGGNKDRQAITETAVQDLQALFGASHEKTQQGFQKNRKKIVGTSAKQTAEVVNIGNAMVDAVSAGLSVLGLNTNKALKAFGVNKKVAFTLDTIGKGAQVALGAFFGQRGGHINQGASSGDTVPAMLERGEYVLNRNAVGAVGKGNLDALNFGAAKRFQKGGMAAMTSRVNQFDAKAFPYVWGGGHGGFGLQPVDCSGFVSDVLNQGGLLSGAPMVSGALAGWGKPGKGPLTVYANSGHTLMSLNGKFAGTSGSNPGGGAGWIPDPSPSYLAGFTARTMGAVGAEIKRLMLEGPKGPLRSMGQGALDKTYKAAKSYLAKQQPSGSFGGGDVMTGSGEVESMFAKVAKKLSTSKIATLALGMAGYAESGMQDLAGGHSTSQGALQLLSSTAAGLGVSPHDEQAIASLFLQRGFYGRGGANSLASQGLPAHMVAQLVQGSAFSSGSNYLAQAGPARAWMSRYGLQRGGMPTLDKGGRVTQSGLAQVHPGDVHMGSGSPNINVYVDPVSLDVRVETIVEGMAPEIAEFTARQLGRGAGRSRQLARG